MLNEFVLRGCISDQSSYENQGYVGDNGALVGAMMESLPSFPQFTSVNCSSTLRSGGAR